MFDQGKSFLPAALLVGAPFAEAVQTDLVKQRQLEGGIRIASRDQRGQALGRGIQHLLSLLDCVFTERYALREEQLHGQPVLGLGVALLGGSSRKVQRLLQVARAAVGPV